MRRFILKGGYVYLGRVYPIAPVLTGILLAYRPALPPPFVQET